MEVVLISISMKRMASMRAKAMMSLRSLGNLKNPSTRSTPRTISISTNTARTRERRSTNIKVIGTIMSINTNMGKVTNTIMSTNTNMGNITVDLPMDRLLMDRLLMDRLLMGHLLMALLMVDLMADLLATSRMDPLLLVVLLGTERASITTKPLDLLTATARPTVLMMKTRWTITSVSRIRRMRMRFTMKMRMKMSSSRPKNRMTENVDLLARVLTVTTGITTWTV